MTQLPHPADPEKRVLHGFEHNEDAVILKSPPEGMALVQTVDILAPIGNDPHLFGQTAAANALSDVYAMGGEPWSAMNILAFPAVEMPLEIATEMLLGGMEKLAEAGSVLAGGHTLEDKEIRYGMAVTGKIRPESITSNDGLRAGDVILLTKPLGTGILATAIKADWQGSAESEKVLYRWTTHLNKEAGSVLRAMHLKAATDITGFGLGGHLLEMAKASQVSVEIDCSALPFMDYALEYAENGFIPAGTYANRRHCLCHTHLAEGTDELRALLCFDAQTSGGLAMAVPANQVDEAQQRLHEAGEPAWIVAHILPKCAENELLVLV